MDSNAVIFTDHTAQSELGEHLHVLADPAAHEGPDMVRVKENASRTVWRCVLAGRAYYLKQYHSRGIWKRLAERVGGGDALRELRFGRLLSERGVQATPVVAVGRGARGGWMLSRAVEPAEPLDQWHARRAGSDDPADIRAVRAGIRALAELVGRMHRAGVIHRDLHTGNVLVRLEDGRVELTLMDLHRMSRRRRLGRGARARNLAQLMHDRRHLTTRTQRLAFLRHYLRVTGGPGTLRGWQIMVEHFADAHARALYGARDRRIFRQNKYFTRVRAPGGWAGHAVLASKRRLGSSTAAGMTFARQDWLAALADPEALLRKEDAQVVKDSRSSLVLRRALDVGPHRIDVYVKYRRRKRWHKLLTDMLRPSRAIRAFKLGHALLTRQIATPLPLAALERRTGPLLRGSLLITEAVEPAEHLNRFLDRWLGPHAVVRQDIDSARQQTLARDLLRQLGRLLMRLHSAGFAHRDLKASNLLVHWTPGRAPEVVLIDLDGLSVHGRVSRRQMYQGLMRLNVSLLECPSVNHAGQLRMLMGYLRRPGYPRVEFKPVWRLIEQWSARKLRRQLTERRRRQKKQRLEEARA